MPLKPYSQRKGDAHAADAIVNRIRGRLFGISGAIVLPFLPPAVQGLGQFGGFAYEVQDQGSHTLEELANVTQDLIRQGSARKDLTGLYSTYTANDPQFVVTIDREKAKSLHVPLAQITDALEHLHGLGIRQRLRLQQPFVSRLCAGRPAVPRPVERHHAVLCARPTAGP